MKIMLQCEAKDDSLSNMMVQQNIHITASQAPLREQSIIPFQQRTTTLLKVLQLIPRPSYSDLHSQGSRLWWRSTTRERLRTLSLSLHLICTPTKVKTPLAHFQKVLRWLQGHHHVTLTLRSILAAESVTNSRRHFQRIQSMVLQVDTICFLANNCGHFVLSNTVYCKISVNKCHFLSPFTCCL